MRGNKVIIERTLKINSKIEIAIVNDEENKIFAQSIIQEVDSDSFSIMVPIHNGHALYLTEGDEVVVSLLLNNVRYAFKTEVTGKKNKTELKLVVLKNPQKLTTSDRRNLVRIKTLIPIEYEVLKFSDIDNWQNILPKFNAYITDLSGQGLNLSLDWPVSIESLMVIIINLETNHINTQVKLLGEVVRSERIDKRYRIGIKFINITERQQDLVINYVFYSLRKSIQLHKDNN
jgi:c-di-GMP-binding flagellar brake protein YcgR